MGIDDFRVTRAYERKTREQRATLIVVVSTIGFLAIVATTMTMLGFTWRRERDDAQAELPTLRESAETSRTLREEADKVVVELKKKLEDVTKERADALVKLNDEHAQREQLERFIANLPPAAKAALEDPCPGVVEGLDLTSRGPKVRHWRVEHITPFSGRVKLKSLDDGHEQEVSCEAAKQPGML